MRARLHPLYDDIDPIHDDGHDIPSDIVDESEQLPSYAPVPSVQWSEDDEVAELHNGYDAWNDSLGG
jgi:hypothetical protein